MMGILMHVKASNDIYYQKYVSMLNLRFILDHGNSLAKKFLTQGSLVGV